MENSKSSHLKSKDEVSNDRKEIEPLVNEENEDNPSATEATKTRELNPLFKYTLIF